MMVKMAGNGKFSQFFDGGQHDVGGIDHRSMPYDGGIKISNNRQC